MHGNSEMQKINQTSAMPEKTDVHWSGRFSVAPMLDESFGRLITGDHYNAMKDGPVASNTYDIIKIARGDGRYILMVVMSILCEKHFLYQV